MMETGWILYVLFAGLMVVFWRKGGGRRMEKLFEENHRHHGEVLRVIGKHPRGGTWKQHQRWMGVRKKKKA